MAWSLAEKGKNLEPLVFSNGKTQEDIVKEVMEAIKQGHKLIFIKGVCGTGKSAIALNLAKEVGRTSVVVPIKSLQKQYEEDYTHKYNILKDNNEKLKINLITGRNNHKCIFKKGLRADNTKLPCSIEIKEENINELREYVKMNPLYDEDDVGDVKDLGRFSVAPACPHWSPVFPADFKIGQFARVKTKKYKAVNNVEFKIYKREAGCSYYEQYDSYADSDVIIFNSKKYELENAMNRKPATELEIIDECDEFLDSLTNENRLNLDRLEKALNELKTDEASRELISEINAFLARTIRMEKVRRREDNEVNLIKNTDIIKLLKYFLKNEELENLVELEEYSYVSRMIEIAKIYESFLNETYVSFFKDIKDNLWMTLVTINLEKRLKELMDKNKVFVMMSGTIHSPDVLRNIFGIKDFKIIEAETKFPGTVTKVKTGLERDFRYRNFQNNKLTRQDYLNALSKCVEKAKKPVLIHVNSFKDLPSIGECDRFDIDNLKTGDELRHEQETYRKGELVREFKDGIKDVLFSTQCIRGVDFPGEMCNSIVFTKYPYPNAQDLFWKVLGKAKPDAFWMFYNDKARREFLQRMYRGLRFKDDKIDLLSPDLKVFSSV